MLIRRLKRCQAVGVLGSCTLLRLSVKDIFGAEYSSDSKRRAFENYSTVLTWCSGTSV